MRAKKNALYVVFGCKFEAAFCDYTQLVKNINEMFKEAVERYNRENQGADVGLKFSALHEGYGEHLFKKLQETLFHQI